MEQLGQQSVLEHNRRVTIISQDSFYRDLTLEEHKKANKGGYNFDHPGISIISFFFITIFQITIIVWTL